ncbi:MAG: hypothetical protein WCA46_02000 [Actinocatenispora sp.]
MKFRIGRAVSGAMALAAAAILTTAGAASAAEPPGGIVWDHTWSTTGVTVYVEEHGDIISVCDTSANGDAAYVEVYANYAWPYTYLMTATGGSGTCTTHRASDGGKYNLDEGVDVDVRGDGGEYGRRDTFVNDH